MSLRPVRGSSREIVDALRAWLAEVDEPQPLIIETSGSTGKPKRVVLTRTAILASVAATTRHLGASGCWLLTLPATYIAGLQVVVRSLVAGHDPILVEDHGSLAAGFDSAPPGPRFISLVSAQLTGLLDDPADAAALQGCHTVLLGGGPIDRQARSRAEAAGINVVATYGSSETAGGCVYDGVPLDGVAVALADDAQILIAGPMLFSAYAENPGLTAEVLRDGWFHTSDRGELDGAGRLRVLGRLDDVIISGGVKVPASAVAQRLREHPDVAQAEVIGVPDERWGERVVAVVSRHSLRPLFNHQELLADIRDFVAEELSRAWSPHQLVILEQIPRTASGKPDRATLVKLAEDQL